MAIQEVTEEGKLQEIEGAQGGDWGGGIYVDAQYKEMLEEIVSKPDFEAFRMKYTGDCIDLFRFIQISDTHQSKKVYIQVPMTLLDISDRDIKDLTKDQGFEKDVTWKRDKIFIEPKKYEDFSNHVIDKIVMKVEDILMSKEAKGTDIILMAGGFSESDILQTRIRESFPACKVVTSIPPECGLAVLKGAVIFGFDPNMIAARVMKYTYGVDTNTVFIEGTHPESKKTVINGNIYCEDTFDIHVKKGETVYVDDITDKTYYPIYQDQTSVKFRVFASETVDPKYIDDEGCKEMGSLTVPMPDTSGGTNRKVKAKLKFGKTKLTVEGIDETTMTSVDIKFDFLEGSP